MIKIFLVEDEVVIRNSIKNSIDWEREGYEFMGEAGDGELAYPLIIQTKPDILLTDIKMPFMDGLELSEAVKKELPDIKIIILSGYNDFEFAKRGIEIGITDYLLKPISAEELMGAIREVATKIRKEREERALLQKYEEDIQENQAFERQHLLTRILMESMTMTEILEEGRKLGLDLSARMYNFVLFKLMNYGRREIQQELMAAFMSIESYIDAREQVYSFNRGVEGWGFLFLAEDEKELDTAIEKSREDIQNILEKFPEVEYFGGIGKPVSRLRELKDSFQDAERAFSARFGSGKNRIVSRKELCEENEAEPVVDGIGSMRENREMIAKFLRKGTEEEIGSFAKTFFEEILGENINSMMMRQYILIDIYITVVSFGENLGVDSECISRNCGDMNEIQKNVSGVQNMKEYVVRLLKEMIKIRDGVSGQRYSDIIESARKYIQENYMSDEISLGTVASSVGMSSSYFSSLFSQETGKTFVEYLTGIRMEKAKELLMCSGKKTSEIGYEVGYKDSHYFSYIFKKTQKCTPKEYRTRGKV